MRSEPALWLAGRTYRLRFPSPVPALCYALTALVTAALGLGLLFATVPLVGAATAAAVPVAGVALLVLPPVVAARATRALLARYPRLGGRFELALRTAGGRREGEVRPRYN